MKEFNAERFSGSATVVTGHFGAGKTNFSVNLSAALAGVKPVFLIDYDNINPYFRALDAKDALTEKNVRIIASVFANSNVDIPSVPSDIIGALNAVQGGASAVLDVGGDMLGAISLGYIHDKIVSVPFNTVYVFNAYRPLTSTPYDAFGVMREIESVSGLKTTFLVNNSNIGDSTTAEDIKRTSAFADELVRLSGVPLLCTCYMTEQAPDVAGDLFRIRNYTKRLF